jgi:ribosomal protein L7Ae-like RNA K-turn-binding protein
LAENEIDPEALLKQLTVSDLVLSMLASAVQLGYAKLAEGELEQTQLAIEALRALLPVVEDAAPAEVVRDLRQATANLQLAYASKSNESSAAHDESEGET